MAKLTLKETYKGHRIYTNGLYYYCHAMQLFEYHSLTALKGQITVMINKKKALTISQALGLHKSPCDSPGRCKGCL